MQLINPEVRIENTSKCQALCTICPREKMTRDKVTMSHKHFINLANQAKELGAETVSIFGFGEPLMDTGIVKKVEYCTNLGMKTFITTNGGLLSVNVAHALLKAGLTHIRFSAHGFGDNYEKVHVNLKWPKTLRNIMNFLAINKTKFNCETSMSVIPMNGESVAFIKKFWEPHVDYLEIWRPHNWTDGREFRDVVIRKKSCGRPFNGPVQIMADGKMIACCFDFDGKIIIGDTHKNTIEEILKGSELRELRKKHETGHLGGTICEVCDQLNQYENSPLLYSNRDSDCEAGKTSSTKFKLKEM